MCTIDDKITKSCGLYQWHPITEEIHLLGNCVVDLSTCQVNVLINLSLHGNNKRTEQSVKNLINQPMKPKRYYYEMKYTDFPFSSLFCFATFSLYWNKIRLLLLQKSQISFFYVMLCAGAVCSRISIRVNAFKDGKMVDFKNSWSISCSWWKVTQHELKRITVRWTLLSCQKSWRSQV